MNITEIDFQILDFIRENIACPFLDVLMPIITFFGDGGWVWIAAALAMLLTKKHRIDGIALGTALLGGLIIGNLILKNAVARDRPCWIREISDMLIAVPKDYSFPSGHTLASCEAAAVFAHKSGKAGLIAVTAAALISFSRLYLYVHFPSDVLAGAVLGTAIGITACVVTDVYIAPRLKQGAKKAE
ncbi:MAG: phosphatase PAP2 family protein [Ruminococcus sp.]|nr:phosphatase PAP2 family protein [Ruminococcus sp.]